MRRILSLAGQGLVATCVMFGALNAPAAFADFLITEQGQITITTKDYWPTPETDAVDVNVPEAPEGVEVHQEGEPIQEAVR